MAKVRGAVVLSSLAFVKDSFGSPAHDAIIKALPARHCGTFLGPVHDSSWEPLVDLVAYMEKAHELLAPQEPQFYRAMGHFAGRMAQRSGLRSLLKSPEVGTRQASILWLYFYDTGRLEIVERGTAHVVTHICDFPTSPSLCQRIAGFWEGNFEGRAQVEERVCSTAGSPWCELVMRWRQD